MKFVCEKCDTKYTIADSRLRNKVLKIRCKSCGNIIEVRDPNFTSRGAASKPTPAEKAPAKRSVLEDKFAESFRATATRPEAGTPGLFKAVTQTAKALEKEPADQVCWFVAIDDEPVGPTTARKIHKYRRTGKVKDASLVWKESMPDWAPLRDCKELIGLLAHIDIEGSTQSTESEPAKQESPRLGLFGEEQPTADSPLKGQDIGVVAKRLDAQSAAEEAPSTKGVVSITPPPADDEQDEQPLIVEPSGFEPQEDESGLVPNTGQRDLASIRPLSLPRPVTQRRVVLLAAVGFFFVAIVVFLMEFLSPEKEYVTEYVEKVVYRDRIVEVPSSQSRPGRGKNSGNSAGKSSGRSAKGRKGTQKTKTKLASTNKEQMDDKTKKLMEQLGLSGPGGGQIGNGRRKNGSTKANGLGKLSETQLKSVVNRNKARLKVCYERALKQGDAPPDRDIRVNFSFVVGSSGMVKNIKLGGSGAQFLSLRQCLERSVKKWVFPPSTGNSPVEFPFLFTPR